MTETEPLRGAIEKIEEAYEYMLAYAAQGRADEGAGPDGAQIREFLRQFEQAVADIVAQLESVPNPDGCSTVFLEELRQLSGLMASVLGTMLARDNISSEVVDNANGLISVRSYLTSLFFLDKAVLS